MAQSFDGDIRLSVGVDPRQVTEVINNLAKSIGGTFANATASVNDLNKATSNYTVKAQKTKKSVADLGAQVENTAKSIDKIDGTKSAERTTSAFEKAGKTIGGVLDKFVNSFRLDEADKTSTMATAFSNIGKAVNSARQSVLNFFTLSDKNTLEPSLERTKEEAQKVGSSISNAMEQVASSNNKASKAELQHENRVINLQNKIDALERKQAELAQQQIPTEQYKVLEKEIAKAEQALQRLLNRAEDKYTSQGKSVPEALNNQIDMAYKNLERLESGMERLKQSGKAYTPGTQTEAFSRTTQDLERARREMEILNTEQEKTSNTSKKVSSNIGNNFKNAFHKIRTLGSKMWGGIKNIFHRMKDGAKSSADSMDKSFKKGFKRVLKYALGIRSFYILFRKIRAAAKESLSAMAAQFPEVNSQLSALKNSFIQLKGSIGTLVQPLLQILAPALTTVINLLTQAATAVGNFLALLTGQKYIYKAQKGTTSFADAQDKSTAATKKNTKALEDNQKQLGFYDKLNIIDQDKDNSGSGNAGSGGGASGSEMTFEKVPVDSAISDFVKRLKAAWKKADLTEIGVILGTKLRDALNKIPWKKIQVEAEKMGKRLGTLIAGFISVPGLAKSIGKTIGQALNTVLISLKTFVKNVKWQRFGKFLADGLSSALLVKDKNGTTLIGNIVETFVSIVNAAIDSFLGFVKNMKWKEIGKEIAKWIKWAIKQIKVKEFAEACGRLVNGIVDLVYEIVSDKQAWKDLGTKIAEGINKFFKTVKWSKFGKTISDSISGILDAIIAALDTLEWEEIGKAIGDFLGNLDWWGIFKKSLEIIGKAFWGTLKALFTPSGNIQGDIIKAIIGGLGIIFVASKFGGLITKITNCFSGIFGTSLSKAASSAAVSSKLTSSLSGVLGTIGSKATIVTAAAGLGFAIGSTIAGAINSKMDDWYKDIEKKSRAAADAIRKKLEPAMRDVTSSEQIRKNTDNLVNDINNSFKKVDGSKLLSTFKKLASRTNLTKEETRKYKEVCEKIVKKYPQLKGYFDKSTGLFKGQKDEIYDVIDAYKRYSKAVIAESKKAVLEEEISKMNEKITTLKKDLIDAKKLYDDAKTKYNNANSKATAIENANPFFYWADSDWQKAHEDAKTAAKEQLAASKGYASIQTELNKVTDSAKNAKNELKKVNNVINNSKIDPSKWEKASQKMKESIDKLELPEKKKKAILNQLKSMVDKGKISFDQYNKIAEGSYKKTDDLYKKIKDVAGQKVTAQVKAKVDGIDKVKELRKYLKERTPTKNVRINVNYGFKVNGKTPTGTISAAQMAYLWSTGKARANAEGGIFTGSGWHDVQGYAKGGSPKSGQFFMARENGIPELVGTIKNHTAVMNNNQIVASVANGVYMAVAGVANAILPYVRSQTHAMNWLAQNGLKLPETPSIARGSTVPNSADFLAILAGKKTSTSSDTILQQLLGVLTDMRNSKEPIIVQMPNGKVLAETVWDEEAKRYKQTRSSTLRPKYS